MAPRLETTLPALPAQRRCRSVMLGSCSAGYMAAVYAERFGTETVSDHIAKAELGERRA